ncbi:MAG: EAL domain-containing protein [Alphaproteobacteria bacterium]
MMQKHNNNTGADFSSELIPSFLLPEHLIKAEEKSKENQNVIDISAKQDTRQKHSRLVIRDSLYNAVECNHIDLFMQPIVTLPQRRTKFYELFGRLNIKSGNFLPAKDYISLAYEENMIAPLDTIILSHGLKTLQKHKTHDAISYFVNIKPFILRNQYFMQELLSYISKNKALAERLVFEITAQDFLHLSPDECKVMRALAQIGCRFSIDHAPTLPKDIKSLRAHNVSFIKIDAQTLKEKGETDEGFEDLLSRKHTLYVNGIEVIVQKIEDEQALLDCLDYEVNFGQGYLFGRPDFESVYR